MKETLSVDFNFNLLATALMSIDPFFSPVIGLSRGALTPSGVFGLMYPKTFAARHT